jgi:hypothetical protein
MIILFLSGCVSANRNSRVDNIFVFLEKIKESKFESAKAMICINPYTSNADETRIHDMKNTTELLLKYGVPSTDSWSIEYDTSGFVKIESYIIPIFNGFDSITRLEEAHMRISFDYTGIYIGDSIFHYVLYTKLR